MEYAESAALAAGQLSQADIIERQAETIARLQKQVQKGSDYKQLTKSKLKEAAARLKEYRLKVEALQQETAQAQTLLKQERAKAKRKVQRSSKGRDVAVQTQPNRLEDSHTQTQLSGHVKKSPRTAHCAVQTDREPTLSRKRSRESSQSYGDQLVPKLSRAVAVQTQTQWQQQPLQMDLSAAFQSETSAVLDAELAFSDSEDEGGEIVEEKPADKAVLPLFDQEVANEIDKELESDDDVEMNGSLVKENGHNARSDIGLAVLEAAVSNKFDKELESSGDELEPDEPSTTDKKKTGLPVLDAHVSNEIDRELESSSDEVEPEATRPESSLTKPTVAPLDIKVSNDIGKELESSDEEASCSVDRVKQLQPADVETQAHVVASKAPVQISIDDELDGEFEALDSDSEHEHGDKPNDRSSSSSSDTSDSDSSDSSGSDNGADDSSKERSAELNDGKMAGNETSDLFVENGIVPPASATTVWTSIIDSVQPVMVEVTPKVATSAQQNNEDAGDGISSPPQRKPVAALTDSNDHPPKDLASQSPVRLDRATSDANETSPKTHRSSSTEKQVVQPVDSTVSCSKKRKFDETETFADMVEATVSSSPKKRVQQVKQTNGSMNQPLHPVAPVPMDIEASNDDSATQINTTTSQETDESKSTVEDTSASANKKPHLDEKETGMDSSVINAKNDIVTAEQKDSLQQKKLFASFKRAIELRKHEPKDAKYVRRTLDYLAKCSAKFVDSRDHDQVPKLCTYLAETFVKRKMTPVLLVRGALGAFRSPRLRHLLEGSEYLNLHWLAHQVLMRMMTPTLQPDTQDSSLFDPRMLPSISECLMILRGMLVEGRPNIGEFLPENKAQVTKEQSLTQDTAVLAQICALYTRLCQSAQQLARSRVLLYDLVRENPDIRGLYFAMVMVETNPAILEREFDEQCNERDMMLKDTLLEMLVMIAGVEAAKQNVLLQQSSASMLNRISEAIQMPELMDADGNSISVQEAFIGKMFAKLREVCQISVGDQVETATPKVSDADHFEFVKTLELCTLVYGLGLVSKCFSIERCQTLFSSTDITGKMRVVDAASHIAIAAATDKVKTNKPSAQTEQYVRSVIDWLCHLISVESLEEAPADGRFSLQLRCATVCVELILEYASSESLHVRRKALGAIVFWFDAIPAERLLQLPGAFLRHFRLAVVAALPHVMK